MLDPAQLATLAMIHRKGSLELAAAAQGLTPSAVSQRLKSLEESLGCVLIRRGAPCLATEAGLRVIRYFDEVQILEHALSRDLPLPGHGPLSLRIAVNADSLAAWIIPALASVPDTLFHLVIDDQDHSQDWLRRGEVVAAVTSHPGPLQGCDTLPLGSLRYRATASPNFVQRWFPHGVTQDSLCAAPALSFSDKDKLQMRWIEGQTGARFAFPAHRIASSQGFVDAACAGLGWGLNPEPQIADQLARGQLVEIVPNTALDVPLHWQFTRLAANALLPLTQSIRRAAAAVLVP